MTTFRVSAIIFFKLNDNKKNKIEKEPPPLHQLDKIYNQEPLGNWWPE